MSVIQFVILSSLAASVANAINGGLVASENQFPYMASLRRYTSPLCTASIISERWILTAAHCLHGRHPSTLTARVGTTIPNNASDIRVKNIYIHPDYRQQAAPGQHIRDLIKGEVGLVELANPLTFNDSIQPIKLGEINDKDEVKVLAPGWGAMIWGGDSTRELNYLEMKTVEIEKCKEIHSVKNNTLDGKIQICTSAGNGKSLCFGDSGAPLVNRATGRAVGVLIGFETCDGEFPMIFSRVEAYRDWINNVTQKNEAKVKLTFNNTNFL